MLGTYPLDCTIVLDKLGGGSVSGGDRGSRRGTGTPLAYTLTAQQPHSNRNKRGGGVYRGKTIRGRVRSGKQNL
jgi:hypothetical protein